MRSLTHKLTGATGILIFYSILPEKTLTVYPNKNNGKYNLVEEYFLSYFILFASHGWE
jgi:hypothetical protein